MNLFLIDVEKIEAAAPFLIPVKAFKRHRPILVF
jgi:hypothetical protein